MSFADSLVAENQELIKKLKAVTPEDDIEDDLRKINFMLKQKIAKQQSAQGEVADSIGVSPKEMKTLRKVFTKFDKDASGSIEAGELKALSEELAEPLTDEEIEEGMKDMGSGGKISFEDFVKWISEERDKESHKGMKMRMLKLKMRANHLKSQVSEGLNRTSSFSKDYVEVPENIVRLSGELLQGECEDGPTQVDVKWCAKPEADGRAQMTGVGAPADAAAAVCVNIQLLDGLDAGVEEELKGIYDSLFDMAGGDEMLASVTEEQGVPLNKPTLTVKEVDGVKCLQVMVSGGLDPLAMFGIDSRLLKQVHGRVQMAHVLDEVIKGEGEQLDVLSLEGLKVNAKVEVDRKIVEWFAASEQIREALPDDLEEAISPMLASALSFGSADLIVKVRSVQELFNKEVRESFPTYNDFLAEYEENRYQDNEMTTGMLTSKIVEVYSTLDGPIQNIYKEIKSKIAGPHSVSIMIPTGEILVSTKGLACVHKFFPTPEEIEAHPGFSGGGGDDDDDDW